MVRGVGGILLLFPELTLALSNDKMGRGSQEENPRSFLRARAYRYIIQLNISPLAVTLPGRILLPRPLLPTLTSAPFFGLAAGMADC